MATDKHLLSSANVSKNECNSVDGSTRVLVIGAGPAGLTAAAELADLGVETTVVEQEVMVGGISKTVKYRNFLFDIGGHRFFTKVHVVERFWFKYLADDFLTRNRVSRIFHAGQYFHYPLRISNVLQGLGVRNSLLIFFSYLRSQLPPKRSVLSFEDFIVNRFGHRLYSIFFKGYTEKVWGMPCNEISADWAAQRIKGLSFFSVVFNALFGERAKKKDDVVKSLIDKFHYPRFGPGMMWERVAQSVVNKGCELHLNTEVTRLIHGNGKIKQAELETKGKEKVTQSATDFISSMPIRTLVSRLDPSPPESVIEAAKSLRYRDFLTVALIVDKEFVFEDNWIYVHEDTVKVGRIQNFKNWSPDMVPDQTKTCLGLEYFCFNGDGLWSLSDIDLVELGKAELEKLGIISSDLIEDGTVVRMPKAYPVYDDTYADALVQITEYLTEHASNLQLVGRNGMHKYNNQDHSMLTAMLAVENIQGASHDLWSVNAEEDYHEEIANKPSKLSGQRVKLEATQPRVPNALKTGS